MMQATRTLVSILSILALAGGGCSVAEKARDAATRCNLDVCLVRFPEESFETFSRVWAYTEERRLGDSDSDAWRQRGLRIGKVSAPFQRRVADLFWECGAEVEVFPHVGHIAGHVISVETGGPRIVPAKKTDTRATTETLVFQFRPHRGRRRGIDFEVVPALAERGGPGLVSPLESLEAQIYAAYEEAIIIGPASADGEKLAGFFRSPSRAGWLQAVWVRVPGDQPALE